MDLKQLIEHADVCEAQAFAYTGYLNGRVSDEELQSRVDDYCKSMAETFISKYKTDLSERDKLIGLRRFISSIRADKPHSGYRFYEALYNSLAEIEPEKEKQ